MKTSLEQAKTIQLRKLIDNGVSIEEACEVLDIDIDAARHCLMDESGDNIATADELLAKYKPLAIQALAGYALDVTEEWCPAKVNALTFLAKGEGNIPEFPVDKLSEMFKKMKSVVGKATASSVSANVGAVSINGGEMLELSKN